MSRWNSVIAHAGVAMDKVLADKGILPDFAGPWDYVHRRTDAADLYFVAGKGAAECVFRVGGREPELWDPASGAIRDAVEWHATDDGRTAGLVRLGLGSVQNIAEVRVSGKPLGIVWTAPWSVDLTGMVRAGRNDLEIDVTNLWVNRLIGDAGLPPEKRLTKSNVAVGANSGKLRAFEGFSSKDRLLPSGLLGPVRLEFGRQQDVGL